MEKQNERSPHHRGREIEGFPVVRPQVAGIDLGSTKHWVCAPSPDGSGLEVRTFGATTPDLEKLAEWLQQRKVESIAMESTGVYWIAPHEVFERRGFEVLLVNTRELANVPGRRKTDRIDCRWIQRLHSCGLLRGSFRPAESICILRTLVRDKSTLIAERADWIRRMQKSLDQMNVRVHRAVSDIDGVTGMAIMRAIVKGQRDPAQLAQLRDPHCKNSVEEITKQLSGHWREDHLFSLEQALKMHDAITERIQVYEQKIMRKLAELEHPDCHAQTAPPLKNPNKANILRKRGEDPMRQALFRMSGVDLTAIDGIGVETVQVVVSEYGPDLSRFPTEKHFVSHALLAPRKAVTGGQPVKTKRKRGSASSRVSQALRMAALSMGYSQTALGAYYRRVARRAGGDVAVFATARKLAIWIYRLLRYGQAYVDEGAAAYDRRYQQARLARLGTIAAQLGFQLTPRPNAA